MSTGLVFVWENEPRPGYLDKPHGILAGPLRVRALGQDFVRNVQVSDTLLPQVMGQRVLTYSLRVIARDHVPDYKAGHYCELARQSFKLPERRAGLKLAGLGFVRAQDIALYDAPFDDRMESIAAFEFDLSAVPGDLPLGADQGWIETVQVTSHLKTSENTELPTPPNVTDDTIPG